MAHIPTVLVILLNTLSALALAALRISGDRDPSFQAAAHLYVGGLVVAWWMSWRPGGRPGDRGSAWLYGGLAAFLAAVETLCFFEIL